MSKAKTSKARKGGRRMRRRGGKKNVKRAYGSGDFARVQVDLSSETTVIPTGAGGNASPSQVYNVTNFALTNSRRAVAIAQSFQQYRLAKVEVFVKPNADTFIADNVAPGTGLGVPYFYYMIDKTGSMMNSATNTVLLRNAGAKPIRLDDKTIKITFKPAVLLAGSDAGPGGTAPASELAGITKVSPWITTNANAATPGAVWAPNSVDHLGIIFGAEQPRGPLNVDVAHVSYRLTFEFRKPMWYNTALPAQPINVVDLDEPESL